MQGKILFPLSTVKKVKRINLLHILVNMINFVPDNYHMTVGEKIKQVRKDKGLQQKTVAIEVGLGQSNYNKVENSKRDPSVEVLQKLSLLLGITVDELLSAEDKQQPAPVSVKDKTVSEKIRLVELLDEDDRNVIYKMLDTMLTIKKFQDFFQQNISVK